MSDQIPVRARHTFPASVAFVTFSACRVGDKTRVSITVSITDLKDWVVFDTINVFTAFHSVIAEILIVEVLIFEVLAVVSGSIIIIVVVGCGVDTDACGAAGTVKFSQVFTFQVLLQCVN